MTVNELIGKLNALPEEQKEMEFIVFIDQECVDDVAGSSVYIMLVGADQNIFLGKFL